ncbi:hypothetical protein ILYODFUR_036960 [Ilyodon furcidens]|uniref:NARF n=1 Tax=Ilyodon furcidens TaxID=33524 RepID=A0ABV0T3G8_9TELE
MLLFPHLICHSQVRRQMTGKMSEVKMAQRKEKCENCTKQCNKKQGEDGANWGLGNQEVHGQLNKGPQLLLSACLSCDGCLSEEDTLKISQQNLEEVERVLALNKKCDTSKHKVVVASVCPQSLPFFAVQFGLDITEAAHKLCSFLKSLGELIPDIYPRTVWVLFNHAPVCFFVKFT